MTSNYQEYREAYQRDLEERGMGKFAPVVLLRRDNANYAIPVRIIAAPMDLYRCDRWQENLASRACDYELTFQVLESSENTSAVAAGLELYMEGEAPLRARTPMEIATTLRNMDDGDCPIHWHMGAGLRRLDGEEVPELVAEEIMDLLHNEAMRRMATVEP